MIFPIKHPTSEGKRVIKAQLCSRPFILWEAASVIYLSALMVKSQRGAY